MEGILPADSLGKLRISDFELIMRRVLAGGSERVQADQPRLESPENWGKPDSRDESAPAGSGVLGRISEQARRQVEWRFRGRTILRWIDCPDRRVKRLALRPG